MRIYRQKVNSNMYLFVAYSGEAFIQVFMFQLFCEQTDNNNHNDRYWQSGYNMDRPQANWVGIIRQDAGFAPGQMLHQTDSFGFPGLYKNEP